MAVLCSTATGRRGPLDREVAHHRLPVSDTDRMGNMENGNRDGRPTNRGRRHSVPRQRHTHQTLHVRVTRPTWSRRARIVIGASGLGVYLALVGISYTAATVGDVLTAGIVLLLSYTVSVIAVFASEKFGVVADRRRLRLNLGFAGAMFVLSSLIGLIEFERLPAPQITLPQIGAEVAKQTDPFSQGVGKLSEPKQEMLFSSKTKTYSRSVQLGPHGATLVYGGPEGLPLFKFFGNSDLMIESIAGHLEVSTKIFDQDGRLVAELVRNEWRVAPPPETWDRNYNSNSLEVRGAQGRVVLQVQLFPDRIQLQGEWWGSNGNGVRIMDNPDPEHPGTRMIQLNKENSFNLPEISPLFDYPSALHLGELVPVPVTNPSKTSPPSVVRLKQPT